MISQKLIENFEEFSNDYIHLHKFDRYWDWLGSRLNHRSLSIVSGDSCVGKTFVTNSFLQGLEENIYVNMPPNLTVAEFWELLMPTSKVGKLSVIERRANFIYAANHVLKGKYKRCICFDNIDVLSDKIIQEISYLFDSAVNYSLLLICNDITKIKDTRIECSAKNFEIPALSQNEFIAILRNVSLLFPEDTNLSQFFNRLDSRSGRREFLLDNKIIIKCDNIKYELVFPPTILELKDKIGSAFCKSLETLNIIGQFTDDVKGITIDDVKGITIGDLVDFKSDDLEQYGKF